MNVHQNNAKILEKLGHPGRFVDRVRINDEWVERLTWLGDHVDPADPPGGTSAGQMPPRYDLDPEKALKALEQLTPHFTVVRDDGWYHVTAGEHTSPPQPTLALAAVDVLLRL